jgi:hypothetical protein
MPSHTLKHLHARPHIYLHLVSGSSRPETITLDKAALSSPSLHTLDYTVYGQFFTADEPSEFAEFKNCLLRASSLRRLTLRLKSGPANEDHLPGERNLQLEAGDVFPALESLTLTDQCYNRYDINARHCQIWVQCMDWNRLRHLDLGHASPQYLLPALTGQVRNLVSLRFGFWPNNRGPKAPWASPASLDVVRRFLESIDALRVVELFTGDDTECAKIRPALLRKHGPSLKRLVIWLGMRQAWNLSHFEDLKRYAPRLEELDVPAELKQEKKEHGEYTLIARAVVSQVPGFRGLRQDLSRPSSRSAWPIKIQAALATLQHLRQLTLQIQLKHDTTEFVPDARPGADCAINDEMARKRVLQLYNGLGSIETLRVVFRAVEPGEVEWTYTVERKWVPQEEGFGLVVERVIKGEEQEARRRREPFDPFG